MASSEGSSSENERLIQVDTNEALMNFRQLLEEHDMLPNPGNDQDTDRMLRFLRSACYDYNKAVIAWRETHEWREKYQVDSIMEDFKCDWVADIHPYYPQGYHGIDKMGQPIYIDCYGRADFRRMNLIGADRFLKAYIQNYEKLYAKRLPACSERVALGERIQCMTRIVDFQQKKDYASCGVNFIGYRDGDNDLLDHLIKIGTKYYPESVDKIYVINTPFILRLLYMIFSRFFSEDIRTRVIILGSKYQDKLLEVIDEDQLPRFLGGSCACPGEGGCLTSDKGIWNNINIVTSESVLRGIQTSDSVSPGIQHADEAQINLPGCTQTKLLERLHKLGKKVASVNKDVALLKQIVKGKRSDN